MRIGEILQKLKAVIVWPFTHEQKIEEIYQTVKTDLPPTLTACKELAKLLVKAGPDALAAIADKGFNVSDDIKAALDIKAVAAYVKDTLIPVIEKDYSDLKMAVLDNQADGTKEPSAPPVAPAPSDPVTPDAAVAADGPGLHNAVPA